MREGFEQELNRIQNEIERDMQQNMELLVDFKSLD